jgi:hypothetical protein
MAQMDYNVVREQIVGWLNEEAVMLQMRPPSEKNHFSIGVKYPTQARNQVVYAPKSKVTSVLVSGNVALNHPLYIEAFAKLDDKRVEDFRNDMYKLLLPVGTRVYIGLDKDSSPPGWWIDLVKEVWIEEKMTKKQLFEAMDLVARAKETARVSCLRYFGLRGSELDAARPTEPAPKPPGT